MCSKESRKNAIYNPFLENTHNMLFFSLDTDTQPTIYFFTISITPQHYWEERVAMLPKILIVDDEKLISDLVSQALHLEGFQEVERAFNGEEGLEKYKSFLPDLVIMDIEMPIMDGYESSFRIKSFDPNARILVLTGNPGDYRACRTLSEGIALTLLQKPISLKELNRNVRENLPYDA